MAAFPVAVCGSCSASWALWFAAGCSSLGPSGPGSLAARLPIQGASSTSLDLASCLLRSAAGWLTGITGRRLFQLPAPLPPSTAPGGIFARSRPFGTHPPAIPAACLPPVFANRPPACAVVTTPKGSCFLSRTGVRLRIHAPACAVVATPFGSCFLSRAGAHTHTPAHAPVRAPAGAIRFSTRACTRVRVAVTHQLASFFIFLFYFIHPQAAPDC